MTEPPEQHWILKLLSNVEAFFPPRRRSLFLATSSICFVVATAVIYPNIRTHGWLLWDYQAALAGMAVLALYILLQFSMRKALSSVHGLASASKLVLLLLIFWTFCVLMSYALAFSSHRKHWQIFHGTVYTREEKLAVSGATIFVNQLNDSELARSGWRGRFCVFLKKDNEVRTISAEKTIDGMLYHATASAPKADVGFSLALIRSN